VERGDTESYLKNPAIMAPSHGKSHAALLQVRR